MSDHRKPVLAFVVLALAATVLVGAQHARAQHSRFLAAVIAVGGQATSIQGLIPAPSGETEAAARARVARLGPAFEALLGDADSVTILDTTLASSAPGPSADASYRGGSELLSGVAPPRAGGPGATARDARRHSKGTATGRWAGRADRAGRAGADGRTTGEPTVRRSRMTVSHADGATRPGARPTPGSRTSTRPTTILRPSQARDRGFRRDVRRPLGLRRGR